MWPWYGRDVWEAVTRILHCICRHCVMLIETKVAVYLCWVTQWLTIGAIAESLSGRQEDANLKALDTNPGAIKGLFFSLEFVHNICGSSINVLMVSLAEVPGVRWIGIKLLLPTTFDCSSRVNGKVAWVRPFRNSSQSLKIQLSLFISQLVASYGVLDYQQQRLHQQQKCIWLIPVRFWLKIQRKLIIKLRTLVQSPRGSHQTVLILPGVYYSPKFCFWCQFWSVHTNINHNTGETVVSLAATKS